VPPDVAAGGTGRQGRDPVPVREHVHPVQVGPQPDGTPASAGPSQICWPASHRFPRRRHHAVQLHRLAVSWLTLTRQRHGR
jgi:hypothetical protein